MSFIEFQNLSHCFNQGQENEYTAFSHFDLSIEEGTFTVILGRNGSGKSTLAKHINGLLLPTDGACLVAGYDTRKPEELWQIRQQVGMVFQNPDNQLIAAVVEDDVAFGPENLGIEPKEIRHRVDAALKAVNMSACRSFAPHHLSGGQMMRVAIAGALAMHAKCLVLDEPTAMLDPQGRDEVLETVQRLHREQGITVVYITHFMEEAVEADRLIVMDQGQIIADGTPPQLFSDVPMMKKIGLDVPLAAEAAWELRRAGINLPAGIIRDEELVQALEAYTCQSN